MVKWTAITIDEKYLILSETKVRHNFNIGNYCSDGYIQNLKRTCRDSIFIVDTYLKNSSLPLLIVIELSIRTYFKMIMSNWQSLIVIIGN